MRVSDEKDTYRRLLRLIWVLQMIPQKPRKITTREILDRLESDYGVEISKRTLERDLEYFTGPIGIDSDGNKPIGWNWKENARRYHIPPMSANETMTFILVREYLSAILPAATLKALEHYCDEGRESLLRMGSRLANWPDKVAFVPAERPIFQKAKMSEVSQEVIYEALLNERQFQATYRSRTWGAPITGSFSPCGLIQTERVAYLVARCDDNEDLRRYALHRFESATGSERSASIPKGFRLKKFIKDGNLEFCKPDEKIRLHAVFHEGTHGHLEETPISADQRIEAQDDGSFLVTATVPDSPQIRWWLWGFGPNVEVVEPASLRAEFSDGVKEMAKQYRKR